jgi:pimeloyl-ACP methyl ester carboxylesterase
MVGAQPKATGWTSRFFLGPILLAVAIMACGAVYEAVGKWRDSQRFPQIGRSVRAGELTLNLNCYGSALPTVILDSGLGLSSLGWIQIQPQIAKYARVCSYDRAGYGWSDAPPPGPRTSVQIAKELKALLNAGGEKGPYILVGPSFGGFNIRVYTGLFPADVGGLVFLDATHEDAQARIDQIIPAAKEQRIKAGEDQKRANRIALMLAKVKIPLGIERLQSTLKPEKPKPAFGISAEVMEELHYLDQQLKTREVVAAESVGMLESGQQAKASGNVGDRPTIVITGGKMNFTPDPLFTPEVQAKLRNLWINVLQVEETHLSTRGRQIVLKDSGHVVQFERPDAVIDAVHEVWSEVKARLQ